MIERRGKYQGQLNQKKGEVPLSAELIHGMVSSYFSHRFDRAVRTPDFHWKMWELFADHTKKYAGVIAPRGHAKSTAGTHCYGLTELLFRSRDYAYIVSNTRPQAMEFLADMKSEIQNNEKLAEDFCVTDFEKDGEDDWICVLKDKKGVYKFRVRAFGSEQQIRGAKWESKRPNLMLIDDFENAEQMETIERRQKILGTLLNDIQPAGGDDCLYRFVGTILHDDSVANRLYKESLTDKRTWEMLFYKAHAGFDDFTEILWPEKFPRVRLLNIRTGYVNQGRSEGYSMEYLNDPAPPEITYFHPSWLKPMTPEQRTKVFQGHVNYYAAIDFAVTTREKSDYTVIVVAAMDDQGYLYIVDVIRKRMDAKEIVDEMIQVHKVYKPELFSVEGGVIEKAIGPYLNSAMLETRQYLNLETFTPVKDKKSRARSIQAKMKAGHVFFDTEAAWFAPFKDELVRFPASAHDDQVDALAYIGLLLDKAQSAPTNEEYEEEAFFASRGTFTEGRCEVTGY